MTQNVPWKIRFDSHAFMLNKPLASIGFGQKFGIAALVVIGIACLLRAGQRPPGNASLALRPGPQTMPSPPPAPGRSAASSRPSSIRGGISGDTPARDPGGVVATPSVGPTQGATPEIPLTLTGTGGDPSTPGSKRRQEAVALNLSGEKAYREHHLDDSVAMFRRAVALDPEFAQAYANLGFVLPQMNRNQEAIEANRMALAVAGGPNAARIKAGAHYNTGKAQENMGDLKAALASYRNVINVEDGAGVGRLKAMALWALGKIAESEGRWTEALGAYQEAERISPSKLGRDGIERTRQRLTAKYGS